MSNWRRRKFLKTVGGGMPSLKLLTQDAVTVSRSVGASSAAMVSPRFTPIDLSKYFNASPADFGPRAPVDGLLRLPTGAQQFRGIPFSLGPEGVRKKCWSVLSARRRSWAMPSLEIPLGKKANYLCLAQFCDWDEEEMRPTGVEATEKVGQHLAVAVLVYDDGSQKTLGIRRRFEVNSPTVVWGHLSFAALPHRSFAPSKLTDPLRRGTDWGYLQSGVPNGSYAGPPYVPPTLWICALANPEPEHLLKALRLEAAADDLLAVCGLTLFHGSENPLRHERLSLYRITLPGVAGGEGRWKVSVDLGVVARTYFLGDFQPESWVLAPDAGLGERTVPVMGVRHLYAEITASSAATLRLQDIKTGALYEFDLGRVVPGKELQSEPVGPRIEILEREKVWLHCRVVDSATKRPTPARLAFRSKDGRYIPPYGHRTEINDAWFQDYGADVKLMDASFAYVDGTFQVELPVGDVYLEMTKGFEYEAVRKKLKIEPGQRELHLEVSRHADLRSRGWVAADTHVHFLPPSTAILEGQAEGLNLINLLAAQWGDLFTNVGELSHGALTSHDGETMVSVGTENRQHILGHLALLGGHGEPVYPMSAGGPGESYLGDPLWNSLADWADACRRREGLVVAAHFPYPAAEVAADIVLGKIDAVELYPMNTLFNNLRYHDWYRYLNSGYRLPAVGGTDKMGAYMPVGANRTYVSLGAEPFSFANWAKAVRKGNTFATTGPLLLFQADGHMPGDEIILRAGGGTIEVRAEATSFVPVHRLEIVFNGGVVTSREEQRGSRRMVLNEKVRVPGPGWLAARCSSRFGPTTSWSLGIAAHTSPVYLRVPGQDLFSPQTATYLLNLIEGAQTWVQNLATRPDPERLAQVLRVFEEAREHLQHRSREHGIGC
jgi:hypothetical protein